MRPGPASRRRKLGACGTEAASGARRSRASRAGTLGSEESPSRLASSGRSSGLTGRSPASRRSSTAGVPATPDTGAAVPSARRATTASGRPFGVARVEERSPARSVAGPSTVGDPPPRRNRRRRRNREPLGFDAQSGAARRDRLLELDQVRASGERGEARLLVDPGDRGGPRRGGLAHERTIGEGRDDGEGDRESGHQGQREAHRRKLCYAPVTGALSSACQDRSAGPPQAPYGTQMFLTWVAWRSSSRRSAALEVERPAVPHPGLLQVADRGALHHRAALRRPEVPEGVHVVVLGQDLRQLVAGAGHDVDDAARARRTSRAPGRSRSRPAGGARREPRSPCCPWRWRAPRGTRSPGAGSRPGTRRRSTPTASGMARVTLRRGVWWTAPSYLSAQAAQVKSRSIAASTSADAPAASPVIRVRRAANSAPRAARFSAR